MFPINSVKINIDMSWFVFEIIIRFHYQQSCHVVNLLIAWNLTNTKYWKKHFMIFMITILHLLSYDFVCPSTSVDEQKGNQQREENRVYQSAKHVDAPTKSKGPPCRRGWERDPRSYLTEWCTSTYRARADCENKHSLL